MEHETTTITHPKLPHTAGFWERIVLPAAFSIINALVKNPTHAAEYKEYLLAIRDAISATYPGE